jgi:hypothetical protein
VQEKIYKTLSSKYENEKIVSESCSIIFNCININPYSRPEASELLKLFETF